MYECRADFMFGGVIRLRKGQLLNDHHMSVIGDKVDELVTDGWISLSDQPEPEPKPRKQPKANSPLPTASASPLQDAEAPAVEAEPVKPKRGRPRKSAPAE